MNLYTFADDLMAEVAELREQIIMMEYQISCLEKINEQLKEDKRYLEKQIGQGE